MVPFMRGDCKLTIKMLWHVYMVVLECKTAVRITISINTLTCNLDGC